MMITFCTGPERRVAALVEETRQIMQKRTKGARVVMLKGKYAGRSALVDGVILHTSKAEWVFCCWILRADGSGLLDSDGDSRSYHAASDFREEETET
jgi:hypothetical protein